MADAGPASSLPLLGGISAIDCGSVDRDVEVLGEYDDLLSVQSVYIMRHLPHLPPQLLLSLSTAPPPVRRRFPAPPQQLAFILIG
jgi:hypothetical protein